MTSKIDVHSSQLRQKYGMVKYFARKSAEVVEIEFPNTTESIPLPLQIEKNLF